MIHRSSWKVHAIADCTQCNWKSQSQHYAVDGARRHARKTGHTVTYEIGCAGEFKSVTNDEMLRLKMGNP